MTNFRTSVLNLDRPGDPTVFSDQLRADAAELISRYPQGQSRSALLPLLHLVQSEQGYVTPDGIAFCSDVLDITKAQVAAVATFYTMYKRKPTGEYLVSVCTNTLCGMIGGDEIFAALKEQLGIANNETTADGQITLEHAECLAACDYGPVVTVNYEFFDNQSIGSARNIVSQLQSGERPMPTRGGALCTFKQIERQIAGLYDEASYALDANGSGTPTEVGVRLAIERRESAPSYAADTADEVVDDTANTTLIEAHGAEPPDSQGEFPLETAKSEATGADNAVHAEAEKELAADEDEKAPGEGGRTRRRIRDRVRGSSSAREAAGAAGPSTQEGPSQDDAPLQTAESDPENPTQTDTEKG